MILVFGYLACWGIDSRLVERERNRIFDDELYSWKQDSNDPSLETNGNISRARLTGPDQIIVARIANLLRRLT